MSRPINVNTATLDELKGLEGIAEKRGKALIRRREEKGTPLTLEDLKLIPEIPNTKWDPWLADGTITLGEPVQELGNMVSQKNIQKLAEEITERQHEIKTLRQEKTTMQVEFDRKAYEMNADFLVKLKNQEHEHEKLQQQREKIHHDELEKMIMEFKEREENMKQKMEEKDRAMNKMKEEICSVPEDRFGTESLFSGYPSAIKIEENLRTYPSRNDIWIEKDNSHQRKNEKRERRTFNFDGPMTPKLSVYDGKADWRPYYAQYIHIAKRYDWSPEDKLDKLIECLRDKALKFFTSRPECEKNNFTALCKAMEERFGKKDLPSVIRRQLQDLRQSPEEDLDDYADRARELAVDGFPEASDDVIQIVATDAFLKGCLDKNAALTAMHKDPENLDMALKCVKSAITNHRVIMGMRKQELKRVTFEEEDEKEDNTNTQIRAIYKKSEIDVSSFDERLKKTEDGLKQTSEKVNLILKILQNQDGLSRSKSPQRLPSGRRQSPIRNNNCYNCGKEGHFSADCEEPRRWTSPQRGQNRTRSPSPNYIRESLNLEGLKL